MAEKNPDGRRYEVELDWWYVSKETLRKALVVFALLAVAVVWGVYAYTHRDDSLLKRAQRELATAEELLGKARNLPEAKRLTDELTTAAGKVAEAREELEKGRPQFAVNDALEAQAIAKRLLGGISSARGDATVLEAAGKVEVQRASRATWEPARIGLQLYEGDFLKTGSNGAADVMAADGTMYRIRPETLFEVHRSLASGPGGGGRTRRSEIKFIVGTVDIDTGDSSSSTVMTDAARAEIASRSSVGVDVDQSKTTGLSTYRGSATLATGDARVTVGERERAVASYGGGGISAKTRIPDAPSPRRPEDGSVYDLKAPSPIHLAWTPVRESARYRLQIAQSRLFVPDSIIVDLSDRTRPEANVTVNEEGSYFWRVAALGKGGLSSEWSAARRFKVTAGGSKAGAPDTVPPDLVLARPQVNGTIVIVSGKTEAGASVTVNGEPADPDSTGGFKKIISIHREGLNVVEVKAVDGAGNQTVRSENVVIQYF